MLLLLATVSVAQHLHQGTALHDTHACRLKHVQLIRARAAATGMFSARLPLEMLHRFVGLPQLASEHLADFRVETHAAAGETEQHTCPIRRIAASARGRRRRVGMLLVTVMVRRSRRCTTKCTRYRDAGNCRYGIIDVQWQCRGVLRRILLALRLCIPCSVQDDESGCMGEDDKTVAGQRSDGTVNA